MALINLSQEEAKYVAQLTGDVVSTAVSTILVTAAIGGSTLLLVRAVRAWTNDDGRWPTAARNVGIVSLLLVTPPEWYSTRSAGHQSAHTHPVALVAATTAVLLIPVFAVACVVGASVRRLKGHDRRAGAHGAQMAVRWPHNKNKGMKQTKSALARKAAAFAGQARRSPDSQSGARIVLGTRE
jgi:microcompartment protein CcmK/EutM